MSAHHELDTASSPLFRPTEFREYRPPVIEPRRRNYQPQSGFISMETIKPDQPTRVLPTRAVDLSERDLANGRASSLAKRAANEQAAPSMRTRVIEYLKEIAPESATSAQIAEAIGVKREDVSPRITQHMRYHPGDIESVAVMPRTSGANTYRWRKPV